MRRLTVIEKFNRVFSKKDLSVETIELTLFIQKERDYWNEYLELLKAGACEKVKYHKSRLCLLTLYWLRYGEELDYQAGNREIEREGLFMNDPDIPNIIFSEGRKCFLMIKNGDTGKDNIDFLTYTIEAIGDLNVNQKEALCFLLEIRDYFNTLEIKEDITHLKKMLNIAIESKQS